MADDGPHPMPFKRIWHCIWELIVHVIVGSLLFLIVFAPAVLLDVLINLLKAKIEVSGFLIGLLTLTKYVIAIIDALLYLIFMIKIGWQFVRSLNTGA